MTGTTIRQLQWWAEHGITVPIVGGDRRWNDEAIKRVRILAALSESGIRLQGPMRCATRLPATALQRRFLLFGYTARLQVKAVRRGPRFRLIGAYDERAGLIQHAANFPGAVRIVEL